MDEETKKNECGCGETDCPTCNPTEKEEDDDKEEGCDCSSCDKCGE